MLRPSKTPEVKVMTIAERIQGKNRVKDRMPGNEKGTPVSTKKAILGAVLAIVLKFAADIPAMLLCMGLLNIKVIPEIVSVAIYGITYAVLGIVLVKLVYGKGFKFKKEELFMPKFSLKLPFVILAVVLPLAVCGAYLLLIKGNIVFGEMEMQKTLGVLGECIFYNAVGAAVVEEVLFRGVLMNLLRKRWNTAVAVILPSVLFGLVHLIGLEDCSVVDGIQLMAAGTLAGIMFSVIALKTGSVWNSAIVHSIRNLVMAGGLLTISSASSDVSLLTYVIDSKSVALTGGVFGAEASVIAIAGYAIVILLVSLSGRNKANVLQA